MNAAATPLLDKIGAARMAVFNGLLETIEIHHDGNHLKVYREGEAVKVEFLRNTHPR